MSSQNQEGNFSEAAAEAAVQKVCCGYDPSPLDFYPTELVLVVPPNDSDQVRRSLCGGCEVRGLN